VILFSLLQDFFILFHRVLIPQKRKKTTEQAEFHTVGYTLKSDLTEKGESQWDKTICKAIPVELT
jgi:hypothetical protein